MALRPQITRCDFPGNSSTWMLSRGSRWPTCADMATHLATQPRCDWALPTAEPSVRWQASSFLSLLTTPSRPGEALWPHCYPLSSVLGATTKTIRSKKVKIDQLCLHSAPSFSSLTLNLSKRPALAFSLLLTLEKLRLHRHVTVHLDDTCLLMVLHHLESKYHKMA